MSKVLASERIHVALLFHQFISTKANKFHKFKDERNTYQHKHFRQSCE